MSDNERQNDYNAEPVVYCANCYSLKIQHDGQFDMDCCMDCGCSNTLQTDIDTWERLYENRYGKRFITKTGDIRRSPFYRMPLDILKREVCDSLEWRDIIRQLYPSFPRGFSKADSVILLFDKLSKDNRMDDLRMVLANSRRK